MALYVLAKQPGRTFFRGNRNVYERLIDSKHVDRTVTGIYSPLGTLYFTNDPATYDPSCANHYVEWQVGINSFPCKYYDQDVYASITRTDIVNIATFEGEYVKCPEDCTGMFSNMSLGYTPNSRREYRIWKQWRRDNDYSPWKQTVDTTTDHEWLSNIEINFGGFDFSETKIMTSLFENCIGNETSISFHDVTDPSYTMVVPPGQYCMKTYLNEVYTYRINHITFTGLAGWETGNVTDISRMFANIKWNQHSVNAYTGTFNVDGVNRFDFPNVTNAVNLFANSNINITGVVLNIGGETIDLSYAFSNYRYVGNSDFIDISKWNISSTEGNLKSMFRNTNLKSIVLGSSLDNIIKLTKNVDTINYLFCSDSTTSNLTSISVRANSDWHTLNANLTGYKMFLNCSKLPSFITEETNIAHANNILSNGYFGAMPPEVTTGNYIKKRVAGVEQWLASDVYLKTSEGWKILEVYM